MKNPLEGGGYLFIFVEAHRLNVDYVFYFAKRGVNNEI